MNKNELPGHFHISSSKAAIPARYINSGGFASSIVAVVTIFGNEVFDWSAYWGGCDKTERERDCHEWVTSYGVKLGAKDAEYYFPQLPIDIYRP